MVIILVVVIFENTVAPVIGGNANLLTVTGVVKKFGTDVAHRFTEIRFDGAGDVLLDNNITPYARLIRQAGTGKVTITNARMLLWVLVT